MTPKQIADASSDVADTLRGVRFDLVAETASAFVHPWIGVYDWVRSVAPIELAAADTPRRQLSSWLSTPAATKLRAPLARSVVLALFPEHAMDHLVDTAAGRIGFSVVAVVALLVELVEARAADPWLRRLIERDILLAELAGTAVASGTLGIVPPSADALREACLSSTAELQRWRTAAAGTRRTEGARVDAIPSERVAAARAAVFRAERGDPKG